MNTPQEGNYEYAKILGLISPSLPRFNPPGIRHTLTLIASSDWLIFFCFHRYVNNAHAPSVKTVLCYSGTRIRVDFYYLATTIFLSIRPSPFFLRLASCDWSTWHPPPPKKGTGRCLTFLTLIGSFNLNNEHRNSISRHRSFSGVSFLLLYYIIDHHISHHIEFVSICWPCLVVSRVYSIDAVVSDLLFSGGFVLYYALTLNEKKGGEWDYYDTQILLYQYREGRECMISITGTNNNRRL